MDDPKGAIIRRQASANPACWARTIWINCAQHTPLTWSLLMPLPPLF